MLLTLFIIILLAGGILAGLAGRNNQQVARAASLLTVLVNFILILGFWIKNAGAIGMEQNSWLLKEKAAWIPSMGISWHLAMDGISLLMLLLTFFLGLIAILVSWKEIEEQPGFYYFNLLFVLAGITGVFLAMDLFLFYFFWEVMLVPMYFLVGIWGHEERRYAAYKFFIFTQAGGLLMLLAILGLYFVHGQATGNYTYNYFALMNAELSSGLSIWLMLGFLIAFVIKLPVVPFHTWLPDAHTQAPTAGSVILAGLLLKTGAYGIIRFVLPIFPEESAVVAPYAMAIGVIGILYGAKLAFAQNDFKRLVAYSSISHMGFVMLGAFAFQLMAIEGVIMQMVAHGISTGALFIMAGILQEHFHTRDMRKMSGLWHEAPAMSGWAILFVMASVGLPGMANFVAEFLILLGAFEASVLWTVLASIGLIASSIYGLRLVQKVFFGPLEVPEKVSDLSVRERSIMAALAVVILVLGLYPQPVLDMVSPATKTITEKTGSGQEQASSETAYKLVPTKEFK